MQIKTGMQLVNKVFGGSVSRSTEREDGQHSITCEGGSALFAGLPVEQDVLLTHGDSVSDVAPGNPPPLLFVFTVTK